MQIVYESLRNVQLVVYLALALSAVAMWRRRPDAAHGWLAATFVVLGSVVVFARFIPADSDAAWATWSSKILVAALVCFPYFLYRFVATFGRPYRWIFYAAGGLTGLLALWIFAIPQLPHPGQPRSGLLKAWLVVLVVQWTFLAFIAASRLWRGGRGQPNVAKRRMQTLAMGAVGMAVAVVVGASSGVRTGVGPLQIFTQVLGIVSAPLFLAGFAPPGLLLVYWRRREQAALREAAVGLMKALTRVEVASAILPHAAAFLGGRGACLIDRQGELVGSFGLSERETGEFVGGTPRWQAASGVLAEGLTVRVPLDHGWLVMVASVFAPFFGEEEINVLKSLALFVDTSLARVDIVEQERKNLDTMRDFVAIAAHDLRTPVTVIGGFAKLLVSEWAELQESERLEMIRSIDRQSGHLTRLTEDLLMLSRIEGEGVDSRPNAVLVKPAVERIVNDLASEYNARAEVKVDPDLTVYVDPDHFDRIVTNYLSNAYVYGEAPFGVEAYSSGATTRVIVKDQGAGVPREFAQHLFGAFARAEKKTSKASSGTGLGLSIVKGLAVAAGGQAWYEPNRPQGSVFGVELPKVAA